MMPLRDCAECAMPWPARRDFQQVGPRTRNHKADPEPSSAEELRVDSRTSSSVPPITLCDHHLLEPEFA